MFKKQIMTLTVGAVLMPAAVFAQEDYTAYKSDATVQALGSFVKQTTQDGINQVDDQTTTARAFIDSKDLPHC